MLTGVRTNTPPDTFCCSGSNRWKRLDALLVMEIEFCAENPQGQVTSGIFNNIFYKFDQCWAALLGRPERFRVECRH